MSTYFLSAPVGELLPAKRVPGEPLPILSLESLDGSARLPLDDSTGWRALAGATGLEMPPVDVITDSAPGVPGSLLQDVRVEERPVFLPIRLRSRDRRFVTHQAMVKALLDLVDPLLGEFRLVAETALGQRTLRLVYTGGLEGAYGVDQFGIYWRKIGLTAIACQPFARARADRELEFSTEGGAGAFLGVAGGTDVPWPRAVSSAAVIGENMRVEVLSEVPVYPTVELVGPMDSFTGTLSLEDTSVPPYYSGGQWSVSIPDGVPAGSTLRLVTDPRARSIRMGVGDPATDPSWADTAALAAGLVARGSTLRPFYPGVNIMDVAAPGGTDATAVRISWRELFRSLW